MIPFSYVAQSAINDLRVLSTNPSYTVDMYAWHLPNADDKTCHVCLGGTVLARGLSPKDVATIDDATYNMKHVLRALDSFRQGDIQRACAHYYEQVPALFNELNAAYRDDLRFKHVEYKLLKLSLYPNDKGSLNEMFHIFDQMVAFLREKGY